MNKNLSISILSILLSCLVSGNPIEKKPIAVSLEKDNSIRILIDKTLWKRKINEPRVDILFENKEKGDNYSVVDWRARVEFSEWSHANSGDALIRVSGLQDYDRVTVVVISDDTVLIKEHFDKSKILPRR